MDPASSRKGYKISYEGARELRKFSFFICYSKDGVHRGGVRRKERSLQVIFSLIYFLGELELNCGRKNMKFKFKNFQGDCDCGIVYLQE